MTYKHKGDAEFCGHLRARSFSLQADIVETSESDIALTRGSPSNLIFEDGVSGQIVTLSDATDCLSVGHEYCFFNESSASVSIRDHDLNVIGEVPAGVKCCFILKATNTPGGEWVSGLTSLSKVLVDLSGITGVSGSNAQEFLEDLLSQTGIPCTEFPFGQKNCENLDFFLSAEAIAGTIDVTLSGIRLTPGLDYVEHPDKLGFTIVLDPSNSGRLNTAPKPQEDLFVSYRKKIVS